MRKEGAALATKHGIKYNGRFQQIHQQNLEDNPKGHWQEFCQKLAENAPLRCRSCQQLRETIIPASAQPASEKTSAPALQDQAPASSREEASENLSLVISRGHGRPPKGTQPTSLSAWISSNRPGMYTFVCGTTWRCNVCQKECGFRYVTEAGVSRITEHESSRMHKNRASSSGVFAAVPCVGLAIGRGDVADLDAFQACFEKWMESGLLRIANTTKDVLEQVQLSWQEEFLTLKHQRCEGRRPSSAKACAACVNLAASRALHQAVGKWAFKIDLANCAQTLLFGDSAGKAKVQSDMAMAEYKDLSEVRRDLEEFLALKDEGKMVRYVRHKLQSLPSSSQTPRLKAWLEAKLAGLRNLSKEVSDTSVYHTLCTEFSANLASGTIRRDDLVIASKVLSGQLRASKIVCCLLSSFFDKQSKISRGCQKRLCTSAHADEETMREIYFQFGWTASSKALLKEFGLSLSAKPRVDFRMELLPWPFLAHVDPVALKHNAEVCLQHLESEGERTVFLSIDETCWHATYALVSGLYGRGEPAMQHIIGGYWCRDQGEDWAVLENTTDVPQTKLAKLTMHITAVRTDTSSRTFDMACYPVRPGGEVDQSHECLRATGECLLALTASNAGVPPLGVAFDGGPVNHLLAKATLGTLEIPRGVPFWESCEAKRHKGLLYIPHGYLQHGDRVVLGSQDALHFLKRFSLHHQSGSKTVCWGSVPTDLISMLSAGMPLKAYLCSDEQSDVQGLQRANSKYLSKDWNAIGPHLYSFVSAVLSFSNQAGDRQDAEERAYHCLAGYYLLLLNAQQAQLLYGSTWKENFLPINTIRLGCQMCIHNLNLCLFGDEHTSIRPSRFAEHASELHFAALKSSFRGTPSVADMLVGQQKHHLGQLSRKFEPEPCLHKPVTPDRAQALSRQAFQDRGCIRCVIHSRDS